MRVFNTMLAWRAQVCISILILSIPREWNHVESSDWCQNVKHKLSTYFLFFKSMVQAYLTFLNLSVGKRKWDFSLKNKFRRLHIRSTAESLKFHFPATYNLQSNKHIATGTVDTDPTTEIVSLLFIFPMQKSILYFKRCIFLI